MNLKINLTQSYDGDKEINDFFFFIISPVIRL